MWSWLKLRFWDFWAEIWSSHWSWSMDKISKFSQKLLIKSKHSIRSSWDFQCHCWQWIGWECYWELLSIVFLIKSWLIAILKLSHIICWWISRRTIFVQIYFSRTSSNTTFLTLSIIFPRRNKNTFCCFLKYKQFRIRFWNVIQITQTKIIW